MQIIHIPHPSLGHRVYDVAKAIRYGMQRVGYKLSNIISGEIDKRISMKFRRAIESVLASPPTSMHGDLSKYKKRMINTAYLQMQPLSIVNACR